MARKGIMSGLLDGITDGKFTAVNSESETPAPTPTVETSGRRGAFGMMSRAADEMAAKVAAAEEIEKQLINGSHIIELDPNDLETSFVLDRLEDDDDTSLQELIAAIRERGQDTPILVRPNPSAEGKYQIVFGHRRVKAAKALNIRVKATVKQLSDRDHAIAQGQENTARADLSFIERALFARKLAEQFDNETVMSALAVNKTVLSKMQSVTNYVPSDLILKIGPSKGIGRDRWYDLSVAFRDGIGTDIDSVIDQDKFYSASSDERFLMVLATAKSGANSSNKQSTKEGKKQPLTKFWKSKDNLVAFSMNRKPKKVDISLRSDDAGPFGEWLSTRLEGLYEEFRQSEPEHGE
ncbi:plasmid partitioning protein RepB [Ochrobactrum sp. Marseille-Q0166]|uniref:plasmid partitioning protein RepB n=1 Tax=Ochrobactrum sp. Marseille-Q0166 TaxID=2761105 RepID=UPI0016553BC2|nr:plasmid partitioning protein RepB [Ochrobactrum sp. Marseille-Q0166]MBC8719925.1 plasmid partitioning protein RepB [Ochrobactrum sp. Marseille-Q0166]